MDGSAADGSRRRVPYRCTSCNTGTSEKICVPLSWDWDDWYIHEMAASSRGCCMPQRLFCQPGWCETGWRLRMRWWRNLTVQPSYTAENCMQDVLRMDSKRRPPSVAGDLRLQALANYGKPSKTMTLQTPACIFCRTDKGQWSGEVPADYRAGSD